MPDEAADFVEVGQGRADPELLYPIEYYYAKWTDEDEERDLPYRKFYDGEQTCDDAGPYIHNDGCDIYNALHVHYRQQTAKCDYSR